MSPIYQENSLDEPHQERVVDIETEFYNVPDQRILEMLYGIVPEAD